MNRTPCWYFSLRSPYSWMAYRDLKLNSPELLERINWYPFWEPDRDNAAALEAENLEFPYVAMSRAKHLYILRDVGRLAAARRLDISWPQDRNPWWEVPHLAYLAAEEQGRGPDYVDAVYAARWEHGLNICDPTVIASIGDSIGLDGAQLSRACVDPHWRQVGLDALRRVVDAGVFGVPYFVNGFHKFWGIDRLAAFADSVGAPARPQVDVPSNEREPLALAADAGHAGGCG